MNISRIQLIVVLPLITFNVLAQKHKNETVILSDGTSITGNIIADSADYLKIKIKRPRLIILNKAQVSAAVLPEHASSTGKLGYYLQLSSSVLAGQSSSGKTGDMSIRLLNAYQFRNGLSIGIGTGIEKFDVLLIPAYADLRFHPMKTRVAPFIWASSGYGIPCSNRDDGNYYMYYNYSETRGGMMFSAGSGILINSWERFAVSMGIGYRYQRIKSEANNIIGSESKRELITNFNRIEILFGILFR